MDRAVTFVLNQAVIAQVHMRGSRVLSEHHLSVELSERSGASKPRTALLIVPCFPIRMFADREKRRGSRHLKRKT